MRHGSPLGGSTFTTSAPKSDRITAALGPAMKLARSTTLSPEKMLSPAMDRLRMPFFEERRESFPRLRRPHPGGELLRLDSRRLLELLAQRSRHESLARLQRAGRLFGQALRNLVRGRQKRLIGYDPRHQSERGSLRGVEGFPQQDQLGGAEVSGPQGKQEAASEFRHESEVDEGYLEPRAFPCVDEVAVHQHRRSRADGGAVHGGDERLRESDQRIVQASLRTATRPGRILHEVLQVVARSERIAGAVPEDDSRAIVLRGAVEQIRDGAVHARSPRVLLRLTIQLDTEDASGAFCKDVGHGPSFPFPGTAGRASGGTPASPHSCRPSRRRGRRRTLPGTALQPGSSPTPCSPPRAITSRRADLWKI